jgi:hypothetical protein
MFSMIFGKRLATLVIATAAAALLVSAGPAGAKSKIKTGKYVTDSGPSFSFFVKKQKCATPPKDPKQKIGKLKKRYCFVGWKASASVKMTCAGGSSYDQPIDLFLYNNFAFSSSGRITMMSWSYAGDPSYPDPLGSETVHVELHGSKASGYWDVEKFAFASNPNLPCSSGKVPFTAKLKS